MPPLPCGDNVTSFTFPKTKGPRDGSGIPIGILFRESKLAGAALQKGFLLRRRQHQIGVAIMWTVARAVGQRTIILAIGNCIA